MVDTLDDEWWIDSKPSSEEVEEEEQPPDLKELKRGSQSLEEESKPKKKRKRPKITEKLAKREDKPATLEDLHTWLEKSGKGTLSTVEQDDMYLKGSSLLEGNKTKLKISEYLSSVILNWKSVVKEAGSKKSCKLIIVTSSGKRAVELNRDSASFRGKCSTAKLFAKHLKLKDQTKLLASKNVDFAVGTPNRIGALISQGALDTTETRFLILDWNWRDVKFRRMVDMPELEKDLFSLLKEHFIGALKSDEKMKIGLF
ncbi:hypothetical protein BSL78_20926 [Apostichopus japonicus]|uniref:Protein CMSS1 n=1 Tax=Stichopus japonicus TaxID=307972 RepID=A0A2G8K2J7_STIJA|nr:hypothetical protein BSL78_20926 [Apostichopus japonicus]